MLLGQYYWLRRGHWCLCILKYCRSGQVLLMPWLDHTRECTLTDRLWQFFVLDPKWGIGIGMRPLMSLGIIKTHSSYNFHFLISPVDTICNCICFVWKSLISNTSLFQLMGPNSMGIIVDIYQASWIGRTFFIGTDGALRIPVTYDNQSHPVPSNPH